MTGLLTYSATFVLGLLHAFEPGHGKSILAAFSIKQANFKVFASLIVSLFTSHFLVLGLFAIALQSLASTEIVEEYSELIKYLSPMMIIAFGGYLYLHARKHKKTKTGCSCGHKHASETISNTKTATITGFIAGLIPCPTAIAPLILSGMHEGFSYTLIHIFVYILGMILALFSFTGILLLLRAYFHERFQKMEIKINFNYLSAMMMIGIGIFYLAMNLLSPDAHQHF